MINIKNISFSYGEKAIFKDFSLIIEKNDRICLFGESGCGKTTLLKLILGLIKPDNGKIEILNGANPSVVFQENRLLPFKTVTENITLIGANKNEALSHLTALGIEQNANKYPRELSGGIARRVAIARALSANFDFLILDEPFAGLDEKNTAAAAKHINECISSKPLILVSHSKNEAEMLDATIINF